MVWGFVERFARYSWVLTEVLSCQGNEAGVRGDDYGFARNLSRPSLLPDYGGGDLETRNGLVGGGSELVLKERVTVNGQGEL